jgi:hypothetical protein
MRVQSYLVSAVLLAAASLSSAAVVVPHFHGDAGDFEGADPLTTITNTPYAGAFTAGQVSIIAEPGNPSNHVLYLNTSDAYSSPLRMDDGSITGGDFSSNYLLKFRVKLETVVPGSTAFEVIHVSMGAYGNSVPVASYKIMQSDASLADWTEVTIPVSTSATGKNFGMTINQNDGSYPGGTRQMYFDDFRFTEVPEPTSMALLALGGLALLRRRR